MEIYEKFKNFEKYGDNLKNGKYENKNIKIKENRLTPKTVTQNFYVLVFRFFQQLFWNFHRIFQKFQFFILQNWNFWKIRWKFQDIEK